MIKIYDMAVILLQETTLAVPASRSYASSLFPPTVLAVANTLVSVCITRALEQGLNSETSSQNVFSTELAGNPLTRTQLPSTPCTLFADCTKINTRITKSMQPLHAHLMRSTFNRKSHPQCHTLDQIFLFLTLYCFVVL